MNGAPGGNKPPGLPPGGGGGSKGSPSGGGAAGGGGSSSSGGGGAKGNGAQVGKGGDLGISMDNGIAKPQLKNKHPGAGFEDIPINQPILDEEKAKVGPSTGPSLVPRNRTRPEESDEQRKNSPKKAGFGEAPSSYGAIRHASTDQIEASMARLASPSQTVRDLVDHDEFFTSLNRQSYQDQIRADIDILYPSVEVDKHGSPRLASNDAKLQESFTVLSEMVGQYEETFGFQPEWA